MVNRLVLFLEMHQPRRINPLLPYAVNRGLELFDDGLNRRIAERVAANSYRRVLSIIGEAHELYGSRVAIGITGTLLEQLRRWAGDVVTQLGKLAEMGAIELVGETYYHSLASELDMGEFREQVAMHVEAMRELGAKPITAENTEFILNNRVADAVAGMGFQALLGEGVERVLGWRSPNYLYRINGVKLLLRNYRLSDDVGFRFSNREWDQYPLTADKYVEWIKASPGDLVFIGMDMETFGEHQWEGTGILEFLRWFFRHARDGGVRIEAPSDIVKELEAREGISIEPWGTISWADREKDLSAWLGNEAQLRAFSFLRLAFAAAKRAGRDLEAWRYLSTSDHLYYLSGKHGPEGAVHGYFSPGNPTRYFDAFMAAIERVWSHSTLKLGDAELLEAVRGIELPSEAWFRIDLGESSVVGKSIDEVESLLREHGDARRRYCGSGDVERWLTNLLGPMGRRVAQGVCGQ
ncbi:MAG: glycoside hydrolase family 57 protein [Thermocladium sp.]|jgi:alpha-amylase|nr:MAG: hypothetical protein AT710_03090 [Thermocladium sp. ECH_B]